MSEFVPFPARFVSLSALALALLVLTPAAQAQDPDPRAVHIRPVQKMMHCTRDVVCVLGTTKVVFARALTATCEIERQHHPAHAGCLGRGHRSVRIGRVGQT